MIRLIHLWTLLLALSTTAVADETSATPWPWNYRFVAFPVPGLDSPVAGRLSFPATVETAVPAVIIAHGSGGVDARGPLYARRLNEAGIATLEIDMWSARGMNGGLDRPTHVRETFPDARAARDYLASLSDIRGERIGLMGFSWGGVMAMLSAGGTEADPGGFDALVALYPVCWGYNRVPGYELEAIAVDDLLIIAGTQDDYDGRDDCDRLVSSLPEQDRRKVELLVLNEATHAFDQRAPATTFNDPYAHRGKGGDVAIRYNPAATKHALSRVTTFFSENLSGTPGQKQADAH
ncbi:Dienelactone hydrolase [Marinobacter daqiaonensis]|uniref:Dienelactone hydrolase n=1 Tax=Marinobacter daqiaonensis TaxID=650891 RepID=A0A1I6GUD2_9GAMM|nr:dienelactone hydrolase family protein [Marinobacter daqiaonensis]SFR45812.1 Dienelactone hydrolase [Marinobacter daqiaonensis]